MSTNPPHEIRVTDTLVSLESYLVRRGTTGTAEEAIDLTGMTVTFSMINSATGEVKVNAASATVVTAGTGLVRYTLQTSDVNTAGVYWGTFTATSAGADGSFPVNPTELLIWIHGDTITAEEAFNLASKTNPVQITIGTTITSDGVLRLKRGHTATITFTALTSNIVSSIAASDTKVFLGIKDAAGREWLSLEGTKLVNTGLQSVRFTITNSLASVIPKGTHFFDVISVYVYDATASPPYTTLEIFTSGRANVTDIYLNPLEL